MRLSIPRIYALIAIVTVCSCAKRQETFADYPAVPVRSETVQPQPFQPGLVLVGTVEPELVPVVAELGGVLHYEEGGALSDGAEVDEGALLARITSPEVVRAHEDARLRYEAAEDAVIRARRGREQGIVTDADHQRAELDWKLAHSTLDATRQDLARLEIRAPHSGRLVVETQLPDGSILASGSELASVIPSGRPPRVVAWAAASDRPALRPEQQVEVLSPGTENVLGRGRVREVGTMVDDAGTVRVAALIHDALNLPAPGEGVDLRILLTPVDDALTVPEDSIVTRASGPSVFRIQATGFGSVRAERVPIEIGSRSEQRVEVLAGLRPGDRVVVAGAGLLNDGTLVRDKTSESEKAAEEDRP